MNVKVVSAESDDYVPPEYDFQLEVEEDSDFVKYYEWVNQDVRYKDATYAALGLAGECGEVLEAIKKQYRLSKGEWDVKMDDAAFHHIEEELGDVLWYVTRLAYLIGSDLETIARVNMEKLNARRAAAAQ